MSDHPCAQSAQTGSAAASRRDHTSVEIDAPKACDFHPHVQAVVDGKTTFGPWANMCAECFEHVGVGLGLGRGQRLIVRGS